MYGTPTQHDGKPVKVWYSGVWHAASTVLPDGRTYRAIGEREWEVDKAMEHVLAWQDSLARHQGKRGQNT